MSRDNDPGRPQGGPQSDGAAQGGSSKDPAASSSSAGQPSASSVGSEASTASSGGERTSAGGTYGNWHSPQGHGVGNASNSDGSAAVEFAAETAKTAEAGHGAGSSAGTVGSVGRDYASQGPHGTYDRGTQDFAHGAAGGQVEPVPHGASSPGGSQSPSGSESPSGYGSPGAQGVGGSQSGFGGYGGQTDGGGPAADLVGSEAPVSGEGVKEATARTAASNPAFKPGPTGEG